MGQIFLIELSSKFQLKSKCHINRNCSMKRRWWWWVKGEEKLSFEKGWRSFGSPDLPIRPLHTSVSSPHGGTAITDATRHVCARSPLPSKQKHLSPHRAHMPCNTSPLLSPSPSFAFMSFSLSVPYLVVFDGLPGAGRLSCSCFMVALSPSETVLYKPAHSHTHRCTQSRLTLTNQQSLTCPRLTL